MHFRTNDELTALIQARKSGLPVSDGPLGSNHNERPTAKSRAQPTVIVVLDNLSPHVSDFDLVSLVPPHMYPAGLYNNASSGGWAQLVFERLDDGITMWNHARHLLAGGHLNHLRHGGRTEKVRIRLMPEVAELRFMFEATKTFMTNPPKLPVPHSLHIFNLIQSVTESDIYSLFPPDIAQTIGTINMHSPGRSLSPPFPRADLLLPRVGRATVYMESLDAAAAAFDYFEEMRSRNHSVLQALMYSVTLKPLALCPRIVRVVLEARARKGCDERVQRILQSAVASPPVSGPAAPPVSSLPTPSPTIASSRSSTSSSSPPPSVTDDRRKDNKQSAAPFARATLATNIPIRPPCDPYTPIHLVIVRNLSPTLSTSLVRALATPTAGSDFYAPTHIDISPTTKTTVLAYEKIEVRPVKYVFRSRDDVVRFLQHLREMDKRGELHEYKADRGLRMCAFPLRVPGGGVRLKGSPAEAGADWW